MKIIKRKSFIKDFDKLDYKIANKTIDCLELFSKNPFHDLLNNHKLSGAYIQCRSINVTGDFRIIFKEISNNTYELIELVRIGTHSQLY